MKKKEVLLCGRRGGWRLWRHQLLYVSVWFIFYAVYTNKRFYICYREEIVSLGDRDIQTMCSFLSTKPGEYSYFSPRTMKMWAGPDHWRFRPRPKRKSLWVGREQSAAHAACGLQRAEERDALLRRGRSSRAEPASGWYPGESVSMKGKRKI